ncbi:MAG: beta-mannosidase [Ruminococcus sp.]|nr:beta-mannosidase [Ruminococcus sp.]
MRKLIISKDEPQTPDTPHTEFKAVYEAENAKLSGANTIIADQGASGGKAVGNFADNSDNLTFTIEVPTAGSYCLTFTSKGLGGNKYNEILVDNENVGGIDSVGDKFTDTALRRVMLKAGKHTVSVKKSWGWITMDKLTVTEDEAISANVYKVDKKLINPKADDNAKELFSYLCDSYGKYTLAGQVCNDGLNGEEFKAIYEATGKYPAIVGLDMMDYCPSRQAKGARSNAVETAIDFHKHGGIATFCWHWNAPDKYMKPGDTEQGTPRWWGGFNTSNTNFDIAAVMDGRDPEGKALIDADIAEIAKQLNRMRDAGVPVLWRPLHEASGGWFWWGAKGPDAYKKLWYYLYDELTNKYGCSNLIWVWNGQDPNWYPGDEYVDVIGEDIYAGEHSYGAQNAKFSELLEYPDTNKLIALTENGTVFDIDNVVAANSRWSWFGTWCGDFVVRNGRYNEAYTEKNVMSKTYNSEYVITLDELPWYKK